MTDVRPIKAWLLDEARRLQRRQERTRRRLEAVRSIMRLVAAYEAGSKPAKEVS